MLKTAMGTLTRARGSASSPGSSGSGESSASSGSFQHFTGANGQTLVDGRWRFTLDPVPAAVDWIDCDGATLYQDRTPGFTWDGLASVTLSPPGSVMPADAQIHVRCSG